VSRLAKAPRVVLDDTRFRRNWTRRFSALRGGAAGGRPARRREDRGSARAVRVPVVESAPDARTSCDLRRTRGRIPRFGAASFALYHPAPAGRTNRGSGRWPSSPAESNGARDSPDHLLGPGDEQRRRGSCPEERSARIRTSIFRSREIISESEFFGGRDTGPLPPGRRARVRRGPVRADRPGPDGPFEGNGSGFFCEPLGLAVQLRYPTRKMICARSAPAAVPPRWTGGSSRREADAVVGSCDDGSVRRPFSPRARSPGTQGPPFRGGDADLRDELGNLRGRRDDDLDSDRIVFQDRSAYKIELSAVSNDSSRSFSIVRDSITSWMTRRASSPFDSKNIPWRAAARTTNVSDLTGRRRPPGGTGSPSFSSRRIFDSLSAVFYLRTRPLPASRSSRGRLGKHRRARRRRARHRDRENAGRDFRAQKFIRR